MRAEDDGTPPAEQDGFLASEPSTPCYRSSEDGVATWGPAYRRAQLRPKSPHYKRTSSGMSAPGGLDIVRLLEENWFWRSSTASPSMAEAAFASEYRSPRFDRAPDFARSSSSTSSAYHPSAAAQHVASEPELRQPNTMAAQSNGDKNRPSSERFTEEAAGHSEPSIAARRAQSADIGDHVATLSGAPEARAHSYAQGGQLKDRKAGPPDSDPTLGDPLGTWAQRVFRFAPGARPSAPTHIPGTPETADREPPRRRMGARRGAIAEDGAAEEDAALEAAWRWRFNRRWRTEQVHDPSLLKAKQFDPDFGMDGDDEDGWDTALGYLEACGPGYHLQIARTTSIERNLSGSSSLPSNGGSDCGNFLMDNSQKEQSELKQQADMDATKSIVSVAKKARDLYKQQQRIERDVQTRWGNAKISMSWAGQHLSAVRVEGHGRFTFVLAKVSDRTSAHRLLVRGRQGADRAELTRALGVEVQAVCKQHNLPAVAVAVLGSGTMEWSRDHRINLSSGRVEKGSDPSIQSGADVVRLAGVLTRAALPALSCVTVNGQKLS